MTTRPTKGPGGGTSARWAVTALDHFAALAGYLAVPEASPAGGGWRRLYLKAGGGPPLSAVGPDDGTWLSLGVEIPCARHAVEARATALLRALAPYEVAVDPDAGSDRREEAVLRLALRLFVEGLHANVVRDAVANLLEAGAEARRVLAP